MIGSVITKRSTLNKLTTWDAVHRSEYAFSYKWHTQRGCALHSVLVSGLDCHPLNAYYNSLLLTSSGVGLQFRDTDMSLIGKKSIPKGSLGGALKGFGGLTNFSKSTQLIGQSWMNRR